MDFDGIYRSYFKDVFLYMCSLSANEDIAEEITQETFVKALRSIGTFDGTVRGRRNRLSHSPVSSQHGRAIQGGVESAGIRRAVF